MGAVFESGVALQPGQPVRAPPPSISEINRYPVDMTDGEAPSAVIFGHLHAVIHELEG